MPSGTRDVSSKPRRPARSPAPAISRGPAERAAAWLATGPLGHLYGTVGDLAAFAARHYGRRALRRARGDH